ncbi:MAG: hypothetical protein ACT6U0_28845 [Shinella sp.]|uniref:hypothetical protein n=1 Tax=Shinella sp. TaxID=1870904 RepID=UPI004036C225
MGQAGRRRPVQRDRPNRRARLLEVGEGASVKKLMTIGEARRVGPGLILVPQNPDIYRRPHNALLPENGTVIDTVKSIDALTRGLDDSGRRDPALLAARPTAEIPDNSCRSGHCGAERARHDPGRRRASEESA